MTEKFTTFIFCILTLTAVLLVAVVIDLTHITMQTRRELETVTATGSTGTVFPYREMEITVINR